MIQVDRHGSALDLHGPHEVAGRFAIVFAVIAVLLIITGLCASSRKPRQ
jgi:hypothetical protein